MGRRVQSVIWRAVNVPAPQHIARKGRPRLDPQDSILHSVISLDGLAPFNGRMRNDLQVHNPCPLIVGTNLLRFSHFAIDLLSFSAPRVNEVPKAIPLAVKSPKVPTQAVVSQGNQHKLPTL